MRRRILIVVLSFTMIFSMAVPSFATENNRTSGLMLTVIGDSIGAGCINANFALGMADETDDVNEIAFRNFVDFINGEKNFDCDAVQLSFTSKLFNKMGASKLSKNLAFPGLRSKDMCRYLGLNPLKEGDYDDLYTEYLDEACHMGQLENEENVRQYRMALKHSDVIIFELGENDLTGCLSNFSERIEAMFGDVSKLIPINSPNQETLKKISTDVKVINEEVMAGNEGRRYQEAIKKLEIDLEKMKAIGDGFRELISLVIDMFADMTVQARYYGKTFLKFIHDNTKKHSIVVVCSMIDPFKDVTGDLEILKILDVAIGPFIREMNRYYKNICKSYGFEYADITEVSLNPGAPFFIHPNDTDQQRICDTVYSIVDKKLTKWRRAQLGVKTTTKKVKKATYLREGYTGDEICKCCGEVILKGKAIPKLMPNSSQIEKLKATRTCIAVKWTAAQSVDGYQLQYGTSEQFDQNCRKITVLNSLDTDKLILNLKRGRDYYVRIRTYKNVMKTPVKMVRVYSDWSETMTVKTVGQLGSTLF